METLLHSGPSTLLAAIGAQMMCPRATDMIGEIATAIANGLTAEQMSFAMRAQPTYNEGIGAAIWDAMSGDVE